MFPDSPWSTQSRAKIRRKTGIFGFQRVSDNRFLISLDSLAVARKIGLEVQSKVAVKLPVKIAMEVDRPVVLDLSVAGYDGLTLSLIYKVSAHEADATMLTWWPRRRTDPDLLNLWLELLELVLEQGDSLSKQVFELASYVFEYSNT